MLFKLDVIQSTQATAKPVALQNQTLENVSGGALVRECTGELRLRRDSLGFTVHYDLKGSVVVSCNRCGEEMTLDVDEGHWVSLRIRQPDENHLVLNQGDMNVRFLATPELDLDQFVLETLEILLPDYPRHEDGNSACIAAYEAEGTQEDKASPFDVLSKYLEQ